MNWKEIYERKLSRDYLKEKINLMIKYSGFEGKLNPSDYLDFIDNEKDDYPSRSKIFEIGCGCGLFLSNFKNKGHLGGVDFSQELIDIINLELEGSFVCESVENFNFNAFGYDTVVSFSVLQYLSHETVEKVLISLMNNSYVKRIFLYDVPDIKKKEDDIYFRKEQSYPESKHNYYDMSFFKTIYDRHKNSSSSLIIEPQNIPYYENNPFRYNVKIWK